MTKIGRQCNEFFHSQEWGNGWEKGDVVNVCDDKSVKARVSLG